MFTTRLGLGVKIYIYKCSGKKWQDGENAMVRKYKMLELAVASVSGGKWSV